jgi:hypothetical protein
LTGRAGEDPQLNGGPSVSLREAFKLSETICRIRLSQVGFFPRMQHLEVLLTPPQIYCLNTMRATKTDDLGTGASKRLSNNIERQPSVTTLSDAYPNNIVVQHMMPTTMPQFITSVRLRQTILLAKCAELIAIQDTTGDFRISRPLIQILRHLERRGCLRLTD